MLTVSEVGERFGLPYQEALRRLKRMEKASGRRILLPRGTGFATRYFVDAKALSESLDWPAKPEAVEPSFDFDGVVAEVARAVNAMDERHTRMSVDLAETKKRLALAEESLRGLLAREKRR